MPDIPITFPATGRPTLEWCVDADQVLIIDTKTHGLGGFFRPFWNAREHRVVLGEPLDSLIPLYQQENVFKGIVRVNPGDYLLVLGVRYEMIDVGNGQAVELVMARHTEQAFSESLFRSDSLVVTE